VKTDRFSGNKKLSGNCPEWTSSFVVSMHPSKTMSSPQYILLLHQPAGPMPKPEVLAPIMAQFKVWMDGLYAKGAVAGTNGLEPTGKVLRGAEGAMVTDGPYAEATEIVGGYILINAANLDEAVAIARGCPGLHNRLAVEVRPVIQRRSGA
jgi:hypothetical protein